MENVRTKRGSDIASNHQLLFSEMKLKLEKHCTTGWTISQKFSTAFLQDTDKLNKFKIVLSNNFQAFHDLLNGEGTTMESNWKVMKEAIISTCHEVLGHKKHHHNEWITADTVSNNRGADIASDHQMLVAKVKLKLRKYWTMGRTISQKFNTAFLR
ncbi:unnamed protein product, partial [Schistosoma margrebowiei]